MNSELGSQWRKWDFHVHTPYSILNNQFCLNADEPGGFDEYVRQLFTKAIEKDIWAIGVTDYYSIDGYKRIRHEYLEDEEKLRSLFPDAHLRTRIHEILVFPNIEFRLDEVISCGKKADFVGYHVIFSDSVSPRQIEENFLHRLSFENEAGHSLTLTHGNIEAFGKDVKRLNGNSGSDYLVGLKSILVRSSDVLDVLQKCWEFDDKHLISVPVDERLSKVSWSGRGYVPKRNIYQQCHCYMTSNPATRQWALAEGEEEQRINEFGSIKPCIWGSDAHSFDRMFEPEEHRYCWIKADPTFDGLLQILCEPKDRVAIQEERPDPCDLHRSIKSIQFEDHHFTNVSIPFSEGLTCIIGGRSTGKSLLLRQLAGAIDPEQVQEREEKSSLPPLDLTNTAKVTWRDGTSDPRKIIYLPQTFLNRTVDEPQSNDGASGLIRSVLLQNEAMKDAYDSFEHDCEEIDRKLRADIEEYLTGSTSLSQAQQRLKETGSSGLYRGTEKTLQEQYKQLLGPENASLQEVKSYETLNRQREEMEEASSIIDEDVRVLGVLPTPHISEPFYNGVPSLDALSDTAAEALREEINEINGLIARRWDAVVREVVKEREDEKAGLLTEKSEVERRIAELKPRIERTDKVAQAMRRLNKERQNLNAAEKLEGEIDKLKEHLASLRKSIIESRSAFLHVSEDYCAKVADLTGGLGSRLEFSAVPVWRSDDFAQAAYSLLDARKFSGFRRATKYDLNDLRGDDYSDSLLANLWCAVLGELDDGNLQLKSGLSEEDFLRKIFGNWYNIHYIVTSDGDRLDRMSPGKKGLVLLELIIELEQGNCPILIDQPEDDLDNQSIYTELRKFIKESKKRRQIIIVTHNANIALGADAEEIIVANQDGVGRENVGHQQFDYRSGAIENTVVPNTSDDASFLDSRSIQEHMCQILEGGREALEQRRRKYSLKVNR